MEGQQELPEGTLVICCRVAQRVQASTATGTATIVSNDDCSPETFNSEIALLRIAYGQAAQRCAVLLSLSSRSKRYESVELAGSSWSSGTLRGSFSSTPVHELPNNREVHRRRNTDFRRDQDSPAGLNNLRTCYISMPFSCSPPG